MLIYTWDFNSLHSSLYTFSWIFLSRGHAGYCLPDLLPVLNTSSCWNYQTTLGINVILDVKEFCWRQIYFT